MSKEKPKKTSKKKTKKESSVAEAGVVTLAPDVADARPVKKNSLLPMSILKPLEELSRRLDELETKIKKLID